jgi:hypothetical protein
MHRIALAVLIGLIPAVAYANIGIPMLAITWPLQWLALLPVVALEGELAHRRLHLARPKALKVSLLANIVSTLIGIPLAWAILVVLEFTIGFGLAGIGMQDNETLNRVLFPLMTAWLGPTENTWLIYLAFAILAVPFCAASIFFESRMAYRMLPELAKSDVLTWSKLANVSSYIALVSVVGLYVLFTENAT